VPYRLELELALAGLALARNWLSGEPATVERVLEEVRRLAAEPPGDWFDAPLRSVGDGYREWSETYDAPGNWLVDLDGDAVHAILAQLPAGDALDAACGTGRHAEVLHRHGHRVVGVDASPELLAQARRRLPDVDLRRGELEALPLEAASVDVAVCSLALTHLERLEPTMRELARVVRPGGRVVLSDVHPCCVLLGGQAFYATGAGDHAYVTNHLHLHGRYLEAFAAAGLAVDACHDVPMRRSETDMLAGRLSVDADVVAEALVGMPAVLVWELSRS
jgi:SAM-dependent methyltransferase